MTFDEWADGHELDAEERELCRAYLKFVRARACAAWLAVWAVSADRQAYGET